MTEVQIILPPRDSDFVSESLRLLTKTICEAHPELEGGYGLGGEYGYGEHFENNVFEMRRYYWGDCDCGYDEREDAWCSEHRHKLGCYYVELQAERKKAGLSYINNDQNEYVSVDDNYPYEQRRAIEDGIYKQLLDKFNLPERGCAVHCTCGHQTAFEAWVDVNGHKPTCSLELPNFRHKASGFEVRWYKWIGRDNELKNEPSDLGAVFTECLLSVGLPNPR
jgi:hypothetical protein